MKIAACKLCNKSEELRSSHVIPNSFFKMIKKNASGGQAHLIKNKVEDSELTQDSGAETMLCQACEQLLSINYEKYSIEVLKEMRGNITKDNKGVRFNNIQVLNLYLFFASIIWRGIHSNHWFYSEVKLPEEYNLDNFEDRLRRSLLSCSAFPMKDLSIRVLKITDCHLGFTDKALKDFITLPKASEYKGHLVFDYIIFGYWIQSFIPGFSAKNRKKNNVLEKKKRFFISPYIEVTEDSRLAQACGVK